MCHILRFGDYISEQEYTLLFTKHEGAASHRKPGIDFAHASLSFQKVAHSVPMLFCIHGRQVSQLVTG